MKIRSLTELEKFLDDELAWRKRELTTLKFMVERRQRQHERVLLLRAAACVLYAHWEGFIRYAATSYVSFVDTQGLRLRELAPNFVALGLRTEIQNAWESNKPSMHIALTTKLMLGLSELANIKWDHSVYAQSNLNKRRLSEILSLLGLDDKNYLLKGQLLDERLLAKRNRIAHGERVEIELDDYSGLHEEIVQLVENFRTDIQNAAVTGNYRLEHFDVKGLAER